MSASHGRMQRHATGRSMPSATTFVSSVPLTCVPFTTSASTCSRVRHSLRRGAAYPLGATTITTTTTTTMIFNWIKEKLSTPELLTEVDINRRGELYPAIKVEKLRKTFRRTKYEKDKREVITAVDGVSFEVPKGSIFGLLGPNSCGKTTTMRCMGTITAMDSGDVYYYGVSIRDQEEMTRNLFGYVMQSNGYDKILTGREHLEFFCGLAHVPEKERPDLIETLVSILHLEPFIDRMTSTYSGGILKRLDLAIALLHRPPILILDEPTVGLDIESRSIIWDVLRHWRDSGGSIILTSHYLDEIDLLCDDVAIMDSGVIIAQGSPTQLKDKLGGNRITLRTQEFTPLNESEFVIQQLRDNNLIVDGIINRNRSNAIELIVSSSDATIPSRIIEFLASIGYPQLFSFTQAKPSLDDVYLAATGQSILDAENQEKSNRTEKSLRKENTV